MMHQITIALPDEVYRRVERMAKQNHIDAALMLRVGIEDWLEKVAPTFEEAASYVLEKNADLYERLAQ